MQVNMKINSHLPSIVYACPSYYSMHFSLSSDTYGKLLKLWKILCIFSPLQGTNYYLLHVFAGEGEADGAAGENNLRWHSHPDWWSDVALYVQPETNDWLWLTRAWGRPFWHMEKKKRENCEAHQSSGAGDVWLISAGSHKDACDFKDLSNLWPTGVIHAGTLITTKLGLHKAGLCRLL